MCSCTASIIHTYLLTYCSAQLTQTLKLQTRCRPGERVGPTGEPEALFQSRWHSCSFQIMTYIVYHFFDKIMLRRTNLFDASNTMLIYHFSHRCTCSQSSTNCPPQGIYLNPPSSASRVSNIVQSVQLQLVEESFSVFAEHPSTAYFLDK